MNGVSDVPSLRNLLEPALDEVIVPIYRACVSNNILIIYLSKNQIFYKKKFINET